MSHVLYRLLLLLSFGAVALSILLGYVLEMSPCLLCYIDRVLLCAMGLVFLCAKRLRTLIIGTVTFWLLGVANNVYHLYLIIWAPPKTSCIPWALLHMKKSFLSQISFILRYAQGHLSSCQSQDMLLWGVPMPWLLMCLQLIIGVVFVLYIRGSEDV